MSAGVFIKSRYLSNKTGLVHPIRIQEETLALTVAGTANAAPVGALASPVSAVVSRSKRAKGLNARTVSFVFPTTAPTGYKVGSPISLPWLNGSTAFDGFIAGAVVTYLGATGEVVGTSAETAK